MIDRRDGVLARYEPEQIVAVGLLHGRVQPAQFRVQFADRGGSGRTVGAKFLGGVVEVRQVDPEEIGIPPPARNRGRSADPGRRANIGHRPPDSCNGTAQLVAQLAVKIHRPGIAPSHSVPSGLWIGLGVQT